MTGPTALERALAKVDAMLGAMSTSGAAAAAPAAKAAPAAAGKGGKAASAAPAAAPAAAAAAPAAAPAAGDKAAFAAKVQIKVARIVSAERQANSEKLLKLKADLGGGDTRQIMAGLQQYLTPEELTGRLLCVVANLKPAKLAGEPSEAMVLAAESTGADGKLVIRTLVPPEGSQPGDPVHLDGSSPVEAPPVLKPDQWRKVSPGLAVSGGKAAYGGTPLMTQQGYVTLPPEIADGAEIH